jgi:parallel beta-helix repeat protein
MIDKALIRLAIVSFIGTCFLSFPLFASSPIAEATFLHNTLNGLTISKETGQGNLPPGMSGIDQEVNWTYNLTDAIYRTSSISDNNHIFAGTYLNPPKEAELFAIEGTGTPQWTHSGEEFFTDASDDSTTLAAINIDAAGVHVIKWTSPGTGTPDWTTTFAGYNVTAYGPIAVSDDGSTIGVIASPPGTDAHLLLFDASSATPLIDYVASGLGFPRYVKINVDGNYTAFIASATLVVFDRNSLTVRDQISMGASNSAMDISGDGDLVAFGWTSMRATHWTGSSYQDLWSWSTAGFSVTRIAISADGSTIVSCWYNPSFTILKIVVHDASSSTPLWTYDYPTSSGTYQESCGDVDITDDGSLFIVGSLGDAENLNPEVHIFHRDQVPHTIFTVDMPGSMNSVDISGDGSFATASGKHVHLNQMGRGGDIVCISLRQPDQLSGPLSGTLGPGIFEVVDTIYVDVDDTLHILPGTTLDFQGAYPFNIYGLLLAQGTETDSIVFTTDTLSNPDCWRGIRFLDAPDSSHLSYCGISHGLALGIGHDNSGGGIWIRNSNPVIEHSSFHQNTANECGGGIFCTQSNPFISYCTFTNNQGMGGGICCQDSSNPIITSCTISENLMHGIYCWNQSNPTIEGCDIVENRCFGISCYGSSPTIHDCTISENWELWGGGIICQSFSNPTISSCTITGNSGGPGNAGIVCDDHSSPTISYCTITDNGGYEAGGILCEDNSNPTISNCVISENSGIGGGIYTAASSTPIIENCTISGNSAYDWGGGISISNTSAIIVNTIIEGNTGNGGIYFYGATIASITYGDFYNNENGNFTGNPPPNLGEIVTTNANGDSCDIFMNIFLDPLFVNPSAGNYHLQAASPCIDAGDPTYPLDPDTTIADIGAFYYDQSGWVNHNRNRSLPTTYRLYPVYPNPFNAATVIRYDVPTANILRIDIYNLLGRHLATLCHGLVMPGTHLLTWNAGSLPSGTYFCRLQANNYAQTQKLILLK